jgi:phenylpropionate dioxygenase-like ring-hydroxylating dioxygenase large terminal subunit
MLTDFWYVASDSRHVRAGRPLGVTILNRPIVLYRGPHGAVRALEDRCPHRGVPLSAGWQEDDSLRCRYHGWRFGPGGDCVEAPSLGETATCAGLPSARAVPVHEQDGWIWAYLAHDADGKPAMPPPRFPAPADGSPIVTWRTSLEVQAPMDLAVDNFIDPAHVPFIHHGIFRQRHRPRLKHKEFVRTPQGFRTVARNVTLPKTFMFWLLNPQGAPAVTTVDFIMPGIHVETFEMGRRWAAIMVIVTPLTDERTRLDFTMGCNFLRWCVPLRWLAAAYARTALGQDRGIVELQARGQRIRSGMHLSLESDTLSVWYRRLQKYHRDQQAGRADSAHPVPEQTTLRWYT